MEKVMEGGREYTFPYGAFVSAKRVAPAKSKNIPKVATSVDNFVVRTKNTAVSSNEFDEVLQLKIGKLAFQNGELTVKVLKLEHLVLANESRKNDDVKDRRIEEMEQLVEINKQELDQSRNRVAELKMILSEATNKLDELEVRKSLNDDEKSVTIGRYVDKVREYEKTCQELRGELESGKKEFLQELQRQQSSFDDQGRLLKNLQTSLENKTYGDNYNISILTKEVEALTNDQIILQCHNDQLNLQITALQTRAAEEISTLTEEILKLKNDHCNLTNEKNQLVTFLTVKNSEIERLRHSLEIRTAENTNTNLQIQHLESDLRATRKTNEKEKEQLRVVLAATSAELEALRKVHSTVVSGSLNDTERKLRESEILRSQLAKDFAEQTAHARAAKDLIQTEYEKHIADLGIQFEDGFRKKQRLLEEQSEKEVNEWKTECSKLRDNHQQYIKMADERLDQHSKTIREKHKVETIQLNERVHKLEAVEKDRQQQLSELNQLLSGKENGLKVATSTCQSLQKKMKELEARLKETVKINSDISEELIRVIAHKDPQQVLDQIESQKEREYTRESLERENSKKVQAAEETVKSLYRSQLEEQQRKHENQICILKEKLGTLCESRDRDHVDAQKRRAEFADKKHSLEDRIEMLTKQLSSEQQVSEQKHDAEIKVLKLSHERLVRKLKTEKSERTKYLESAHKFQVDALEDQYKTERSYLLRQHREEQRDLLATLTSNSEKHSIKDDLQEIHTLQVKNLQMAADHEQICSEMQRSFQRSLSQVSEEHKRQLEGLEARLQKALLVRNELSRLQKTLQEERNERERLRKNHEIELENRFGRSNSEYQQKFDLLRNEAAVQLAGYQRLSCDHVEQLENHLTELCQEVIQNKRTQLELQGQLTSTVNRNEELELNHRKLYDRLRHSDHRMTSTALRSDNRLSTS